MKTIWKYPLVMRLEQLVTMPRGARTISVITQNDIPTLYALVDPEKPTEDRRVRIEPTGHLIGAEALTNFDFVGTVQTDEGEYVWHVFVEMLPEVGQYT